MIAKHYTPCVAGVNTLQKKRNSLMENIRQGLNRLRKKACGDLEIPKKSLRG